MCCSTLIYHVGRGRESNRHPATNVCSHVEIQVLRVGIVVDAHEKIAVLWVAPCWVSAPQSVVLRIYNLKESKEILTTDQNTTKECPELNQGTTRERPELNQDTTRECPELNQDTTKECPEALALDRG